MRSHDLGAAGIVDRTRCGPLRWSRGELASGTVITPGRLVPLLDKADIQRIVYAGKSRRITDLGERTRFFTGPRREAILLRDRRCQHPGCRVPAHNCQVDHIEPRSKGGLTNQDNPWPS